MALGLWDVGQHHHIVSDCVLRHVCAGLKTQRVCIFGMPMSHRSTMSAVVCRQCICDSKVAFQAPDSPPCLAVLPGGMLAGATLCSGHIIERQGEPSVLQFPTVYGQCGRRKESRMHAVVLGAAFARHMRPSRSLFKHPLPKHCEP